MNTTRTLFLGFLSLGILAIASCGGGGKETELGTVQAGSYSVHVFIDGETVKAGAESRVVLKVSPGMPTSITGWIGSANGDGSVKKLAVFDAADGDFDADVTAPSPLGADAKFWFEIDTNGKKDVGSVAFPR